MLHGVSGSRTTVLVGHRPSAICHRPSAICHLTAESSVGTGRASCPAGTLPGLGAAGESLTAQPASAPTNDPVPPATMVHSRSIQRALPGDTPAAPARHNATAQRPAPTHVSADRPRGWFRNQRTMVRRVETPWKIGGYRDSIKKYHRSPQIWRRKSLKKSPDCPVCDPNWRHSARPDSALSECPSGSLRMPLGLGLVPGQATSALSRLDRPSRGPCPSLRCPP